jgi:hypothetical protein
MIHSYSYKNRKLKKANEEKGMVSQNTTVIFGGAFHLG